MLSLSWDKLNIRIHVTTIAQQDTLAIELVIITIHQHQDKHVQRLTDIDHCRERGRVSREGTEYCASSDNHA